MNLRLEIWPISMKILLKSGIMQSITIFILFIKSRIWEANIITWAITKGILG